LTEEEVKGEYERNTAEVIIETFESRNPMDCPAVLVRNHGPFTWAGSAPKAVENAIALEVIAEMALKTSKLNLNAPAVPPYLLEKHFYRKHGLTAYYGQK
jgi:L-ribulose-5-phosphate 4-epimerase